MLKKRDGSLDTVRGLLMILVVTHIYYSKSR